LIRNNGEGRILAKCTVLSVENSEKMEKEESIAFVKQHQDKLRLTEKQFTKWAGKRYIVLIGVKDVQVVVPFKVNLSSFGTMDDWIPVDSINSVKV
jgi:hypothetical protein